MSALPAAILPIVLGGLVAVLVIAGSVVVAVIAVMRSRKASAPEL